MSFEVVRKIHEFADFDCETVGRDVLGRELHNFADKVDDTFDSIIAHYNRRIAKMAGVMAETADRNVKQKEINKGLVDENAALRAKLKVAEDALTDLQSRLVASVYDGSMNPHEALKVAEDALAAIREKGGEK